MTLVEKIAAYEAAELEKQAAPLLTDGRSAIQKMLSKGKSFAATAGGAEARRAGAAAKEIGPMRPFEHEARTAYAGRASAETNKARGAVAVGAAGLTGAAMLAKKLMHKASPAERVMGAIKKNRGAIAGGLGAAAAGGGAVAAFRSRKK